MARKRRAIAKDAAMLPTPERMAKSDFDMAFVHHHETATKTQVAKVKQWHVTQRERGALTDAQCKVIVKYMDAWEACERSPLKSNLDRSVSGGEYNPLKFLEARKRLNHWNARIGRQESKQFVLVACEGYGYMGAAVAVFGESAGRLDAERIGRTFIKSVKVLDEAMR